MPGHTAYTHLPPEKLLKIHQLQPDLACSLRDCKFLLCKHAAGQRRETSAVFIERKAKKKHKTRTRCYKIYYLEKDANLLFIENYTSCTEIFFKDKENYCILHRSFDIQEGLD